MRLYEHEDHEQPTALLLETYHTEGMLMRLYDETAANLKKFGSVLNSVTKLIGNELGYLASFLTPRLRSINTLMSNKDKHRTKRKGILKELKVNVEAMEGDNNAKLMKFMLNPGGWALSTVYENSPHHLLNQENRGKIGEYGLDKLPFGIGWMFDGGGSDSESPLQKFMKSVKPGMTTEEMTTAWATFAANPLNFSFSEYFGGVGDSERTTKLGKLGKMLLNAQEFFLLTDGWESQGDLLHEGDEEAVEQEEDNSKEQEFVRKLAIKHINDAWGLDRNKVLENHKAMYDGVIKEISQLLDFISTLTATEDPKEFFKTLEKLLKVRKDFELDLNQLRSAFDKGSEEMKNNEKAIAEIKKGLEESGEEINDKNVEAKIGPILLSAFKGKFLPGVKQNLPEFYEALYAEIADGYEDEDFKADANEYDKKFYEIVKNYEGQLKTALTKLRAS